MRWPSRRAAGSAAVVLALAGALAAQRPVPDANAPVTDGAQTPEVFRRFAGLVVKLQVVEVGADARENTGTGFFVSGDGHVLTNYHVVAGLVHEPDRYRAELLDSAGAEHDVRVIAVDAVHDLALLASTRRPPHWFALGEVRTVQGQRLYSLGHPGDLGIAIVEGTYNGRLPHTLYPRIHFTGAINPGMSGGPAITLDGRVVGVNVATMGNERGFLVPVDDAARFVSRALAVPARPVDSLLGDVGRQLLAYQDVYLSRLFDGPVPTVTLGAWRLPTEPSDVFQCWGESDRDPEQPWELVHHFCSTGDDVFLTADQSAGIIEFEHDWFRSTRLNRFRFHALLSSHVGQLALDYDLDRKGDEEVTGYRCRTGNLREGTLVARTIVCARAYKRLPGLYDVVLRLATVGRPRDAVISTLTLSGVSWDNGQRVVRRYLGAIAGAP